MTISLLDKITREFPGYKAQVIKMCLALAYCMLNKETISLHRFRGCLGAYLGKPDTQPSSNYQRMYRFFRAHCFSSLWLDILSFVFTLLNLKIDHLALDGTSWKHGDRYIHLLMLCVIYKGVAIPIYWVDLAKKGVSKQSDRIRLFKRAMRRFDLSGKCVLADREYIGVEWLGFLVSNDIKFNIRLRHKTYKQEVDQAAGKSYRALEKQLRASTKANKVVQKCFEINGMRLKILMVKNISKTDKDDIIYLITNQLGADAYRIAQDYFLRWKIELCFKHLKSSGFQLTKLNLACKFRAQLLLAIMVLAYTLAVVEGIKHLKRIPMKSFANGIKTKAVAIFREGIDSICAKCHSFELFVNEVLQNIHKLKGAYRSKMAIL